MDVCIEATGVGCTPGSWVEICREPPRRGHAEELLQLHKICLTAREYGICERLAARAETAVIVNVEIRGTAAQRVSAGCDRGNRGSRIGFDEDAKPAVLCFPR